ncbi:MAG: molybdopterin molybdotransferase MoeA [Chloroflexi bacterium]|nr:molybdopterin molybdotransferase MoeA [Chloroflexota bacterium]
MRESSYPILSVEAARARILDQLAPLDEERVPILEACGRALASDLVARTPIPPHTNSAMDGYAIRHADLSESGVTRLHVAGQVPAGSVWEGTLLPGQSVRIMTGAPLPAGADTVVRFEEARLDGTVLLVPNRPRRGADVRLAGEDVMPGQTVLAAGALLGPAEIGMLASLGQSRVAVRRRPRVAILATGDEILPPDAAPAPGKIYNANSYTCAAQTMRAGGVPLVLEAARDEESSLVQRLREAQRQSADLIVTSGGVSVGDFDLVKQVLAAEGSLDFWWVNMKPGRPMAFGFLNDIPLLALPGNPVAAMLGMLLFGEPAIHRLLGCTFQPHQSVRARLAEPITRKDSRRHYLRVTLESDDEGLLARLTGDQGSGILTSMVRADGLAVIPESVDHLDAGSDVQIITLR